ncbi:MAG: serine/threonine protein kinase [Phycisphaerae bacterium]|nr:serine/threonine protein kinase [Phycisphaerae bacterium]
MTPPTNPDPIGLAADGEPDRAPRAATSSASGSSQAGASNAGGASREAKGSDRTTTGSPADASRGGSSFDTILGKLVVDRGLLTREELDECINVVRSGNEGSSADKPNVPHTLEDLLVDREFVTRRQLQRLKNDLEADRSSQRIPGYKIIKKLGSGAMATVYLGRQLSLDRHVAIKVLPKKFSSDPKFIERFYREGRAAARLNDPNIVQAYDVGQAGEHHYFVMEYVDGETVYDRIVAKRRFSDREALGVVRQVASALKHAHEQGFIHRDIKPKNIMISKTGVVKLADLGLARAISDKEAAEAESGRAFGTPYYISPEQIRGEKSIGPPADIYGLGATFFHMVTGRVPFEGKTPSDVMHRHLKAALTPPDHLNPAISAEVAQVIEMMMQKDPRERYQSARELIEDIDLIVKGERPEHARPHVDITAVQQSAQAASVASAQPVPRLASAAKSPVSMLLIVLLSGSALLNVVLLLALLTR